MPHQMTTAKPPATRAAKEKAKKAIAELTLATKTQVAGGASAGTSATTAPTLLPPPPTVASTAATSAPPVPVNKARAEAKAQAKADFGYGPGLNDQFYKRMIKLTDDARNGDKAAIAKVDEIANRLDSDRYYKKEMARRVRVRARKWSGASKGFGLDELLQTSQTGYLLRWSAGRLQDKKTNTFKWAYPGAPSGEMSPIAAQQWLRKETASVLYPDGTMHVGGLLTKKGANTYIVSGNQKAAHDARTDALHQTRSAENLIPRILHAHIMSTANAAAMKTNFNEGYTPFDEDITTAPGKAEATDRLLEDRDYSKDVLEWMKSGIVRTTAASPLKVPVSPKHKSKAAAFKPPATVDEFNVRLIARLYGVDAPKAAATSTATAKKPAKAKK